MKSVVTRKLDGKGRLSLPKSLLDSCNYCLDETVIIKSDGRTISVSKSDDSVINCLDLIENLRYAIKFIEDSNQFKSYVINILNSYEGEV